MPSGSSLKVFSHKPGVWAAPTPAAAISIDRELFDRFVLLRTMRFGKRSQRSLASAQTVMVV